MIDSCNFPGCNRMMESNGYCIAHQLYASGPIAKKPKEKIAKASAKQKDIKKELAKQYGIFLAKPGNDKCKVQSPECIGSATTIHHRNGRLEEFLFDQNSWMAVCVRCNGYVEEHDAWAREKGFKESKFISHGNQG